MSDHAVGRREIDADRPFLVADLALERRDLDRFQRPRFGHSAIDRVDAVHLHLLLPVRMRCCEGFQLTRILVGAQQGRIAFERHVETACIVELRHEADIGGCRSVAAKELAGFRRRHRFERSKALGDPVRVPGVDLFLRMAELALQIFEDAQVVQRMDVAGHHHRQGDDMRPLGGGRGNQRLVLEIADRDS